MFIKGKERGLFICLSHSECWHGDCGYDELGDQTRMKKRINAGALK